MFLSRYEKKKQTILSFQVNLLLLKPYSYFVMNIFFDGTMKATASGVETMVRTVEVEKTLTRGRWWLMRTAAAGRRGRWASRSSFSILRILTISVTFSVEYKESCHLLYRSFFLKYFVCVHSQCYLVGESSQILFNSNLIYLISSSNKVH